ncbi:MAG: hypothetical protein LBL79_00805 [Prevotella sp.]|jgi:hypothetical protein|nr:hypothetical protein [Prevotella sp.]
MCSVHDKNFYVALAGRYYRDVILTRGVAPGYDISGFQPENTWVITLKGLNITAQRQRLG